VVALVLSLLAVLVVITVVATAVIPPFVEQFAELLQKLPMAASVLLDLLHRSLESASRMLYGSEDGGLAMLKQQFRVQGDAPGALASGLSGGALRLLGWTLTGAMPTNTPKSVVIAAPHTSNWDFPYTLMVAFAMNLNIQWMGKQQLFRFPFRHLMLWLGGIAVNRSQSTNLVEASVQTLQNAQRDLHLVVPPEGTRSQSRHWKTGFYYIATGAQVPIVLGYLDYSRKVTGLGPVFEPSGDIEADMARIKAFYAPFKGKNPQQFATD
jgi:1-acyl-sn-glycerol-3-phosphate acyltransferase